MQDASAAVLIVAGLIGLLVGTLYWEILLGLVKDWEDNANYSHGFIVPLFSGFLVWRRWEVLKTLSLKGSWSGLLMVLVGLGLLVLGDLAAEEFLLRGSLIVVLAGLILFHCGSAMLRELRFPLTYLFFMIPLPALMLNSITFPLQGLAARNAEWMLDFLGVPVLRDGNVIHLSNITLGVTEACSGVRSLISLLALAVAWAHTSLGGAVSRIVFICSSVPITIVANAGRVVITGLIGLWFGAQYAEGVYHAFSGWLIFVFAFVCLAGLSVLLHRFDDASGEKAR
jgi:exosortase